MGFSVLIYGGLSVLVGILTCFYTLFLWSPAPILTRESEKTYRSHKSAKPLALSSLADPGSVDLTVVIPAFNETARIPSMLSSTIGHLSSYRYPRTFELIIVDDGSSDETSAESLKLAHQYPTVDIRVVTLERNFGKGGAVRHGMLHGRGRRLLMVDADDATKFKDLELLWRAMDELAPDNGAAVVVGSRAHLVKTAAVVKRSPLRNILMYTLHAILRVVGVGHIRDTQCGFKLFSRNAAQQIFPLQHLTTWMFDVEILLLAKQLDIPVAEVPVEWHEVAGSKLNVVTDSLQMLRDLLVLRANHVLGRWKASSG